MRRIWKKYFKVLYNMVTQKDVAVHIYGFDGIRRGNYFGGEQVRKIEVEEGVKKNGKAAGKDLDTGKMVKGGCDVVVG